MDEILKKDKKINKVFEKSGVNQDRLKGVFTDNKKEAITKRDQKKFCSEIKFSQNPKVTNSLNDRVNNSVNTFSANSLLSSVYGIFFSQSRINNKVGNNDYGK